MASISTIRTNLAARLATITGLRTAATMPDSPNPPIAVVTPVSVTFDTAFKRGMNTYSFNVMVIVGRVDERTAQNNLDAYVSSTGTSSIKLDTRVVEMRTYGAVSIGEVTYIAAEFTVLCYAD
jgi:hypothetical protein